MIYDQCGGWEGGGWGQVGQHSSYEYFVDVVNFYTNTLKVPKEKLCPGVPFYGYQFKSATSVDGAVSIAYRDVLDKYPDTDAHLTDNMGLIWYNGLNTIGKKAQYVVDQDLGGIMIWEPHPRHQSRRQEPAQQDKRHYGNHPKSDFAKLRIRHNEISRGHDCPRLILYRSKLLSERNVHYRFTLEMGEPV